MEKQREELVRLVLSGGVSVSELCRRSGVSRETLYKWIRREKEGKGFSDMSRRPKNSPMQSRAEIEAAVVSLREAHPFWGGRKLRRLLTNDGWTDVPSASTITEILRRHDLLGGRAGEPRDFIEFEREDPNELWQMDYKGHFAIRQGRCFPFTVLDDHSRMSLVIAAHPYERKDPVRKSLEQAFGKYGLPDALLFDNGGPWKSPSSGEWGSLAIWLTRLGIRLINCRPYHPQTQGKLERLHRTLKAEVLQGREFKTLKDCQKAFDEFRHEYNCLRPHDSLGLETPISRYRPSRRSYPSTLPEPEYAPEYEIRKVQSKGIIHFKSSLLLVAEALQGETVGLKQLEDDLWEVRFCARILGQARLAQNPGTIRVTVRHVSEQL